jgi:hypothetical protein
MDKPRGYSTTTLNGSPAKPKKIRQLNSEHKTNHTMGGNSNY